MGVPVGLMPVRYLGLMSSGLNERFVVVKKRLAFGYRCRGQVEFIRCRDAGIDTEATREIEQRTFEGDKQAAAKIGVVDVEQVVSLITRLGEFFGSIARKASRFPRRIALSA